MPGSSDLDATGPLPREQFGSWSRDGFVVRRGLLPRVAVLAMRDRAAELAGGSPARGPLELRLPDPVFGPAARHPAVADVLVQIFGPDIDCLRSTFVQGSAEGSGRAGPPVVASTAREVIVWIAVTETPRGGLLWVVPGSRNEVGGGTGEVPVPLAPGDVLFVDGRLTHRFGGDGPEPAWAATVCHYAEAGTADPVTGQFEADADGPSGAPTGVPAGAALAPPPSPGSLPVRRGGHSVLH